MGTASLTHLNCLGQTLGEASDLRMLHQAWNKIFMVIIVSFPGGFIKRKIEGILHLWGEIVKLDKKKMGFS